MLSSEQKFIDYLHQLFVFFKANPLLRGDIISLISLLLKSPYSMDLELSSFTCTIINFIAASQSTTQSFVDTGLIKRGLLYLKQVHGRSLALTIKNDEQDLNPEKLPGLAREIVKQFNSYGWLIRFIESRDAKIRTIAWSLLCDMCSSQMVHQHPGLLNQAVDCTLKDGELFVVKIQTLSFLIKIADNLQDSEVSNEEGVPSEIRSFLEVIHKSAFISKVKILITGEGTPALFLGNLFSLVSKLIDLDYENTLTVLTQLDIWTLLANLADYQKMKRSQEVHETREGVLSDLLPIAKLDSLHSCVTSLGFLVQTAVLRQPEIATYLSSSTCIVGELLKLGSQKFSPVDRADRTDQDQREQKLLKPAVISIAGAIQAIIANSREVGETRISEALMSNPESLDFMLSVALEEENPMNEAMQQYQLQMTVAKMGASLIKTIKSKEELQAIFDNDSIEEKQIDEALSSRGAFLIEVANEAFVPTFERAQNPSLICDICKSASIIAAASLTAKVQACRGDFVAKLAATAEKLMASVYLRQLGTLKKKASLKEEMNQESKLAEKQLIWVLEILKHIFYRAGDHYMEDIIINGKPSSKKSQPSVYIVLLAKLLKQATPAQVDLKRQIVQVLINLASQSQKAKNQFCLLIREEKLTFLQILIHQTLQTSPYTSRNVLLAYLQLLKTLAMSVECVHAMVRSKFVPDLLSQLDPLIRQKKDIKELSFLLQYVFGFLTTFAWGEQGRKALLASKSVLELALMVLESENIKPRLLFNTLQFLRNICFQRTTKSEFLLNKKFIPSLLGFITSNTLPLKIKEAAATTFWNLVYNHQGVKAVLSKSEVKQQLYGAITEYDKQIDKAKYLPQEMMEKDSNQTKVAKTLEQLQNTKRAIELTITLLS